MKEHQVSCQSNNALGLLSSMIFAGQTPADHLPVGFRRDLRSDLDQSALELKLAHQTFQHHSRQQQRLRQHQMLMAHQVFSEKELLLRKQNDQLMRQAWIEKQRQVALQNQVWRQSSLLNQSEQWVKQAEMEEAFNKAKERQKKQEQIVDMTNKMLATMINDQDPKFKNSKFLELLMQLKSGEKQIEENRLVEKTSQQKGEQAFQKINQLWNIKLEQYMKISQDEDGFLKILDQRLADSMQNSDLADIWQKSSDLHEQLEFKDISDHYLMATDNPFLSDPQPALLAISFLFKGDVNNAVLALQAHVQTDQTDSVAWKILGKLMQQLDQQQKACACFINSLKHDPMNLDSLSSLATSATNCLDDVKALWYLKEWMLNNPKYSHRIDPNIVPSYLLQAPQVSIPVLKSIIGNLIFTFQTCAEESQADAGLLNCLAVLFFINRDYQQAAQAFKMITELQPWNYYAFNKLGATLANLGHSEQAIHCYHKALQIHPTYIKAWTNLSNAYHFNNDYVPAAELILNALLIRPQALHLWNSLHRIFIIAGRNDLVLKSAAKDPLLFMDQFKLMNPGDLPHPQFSYKQAFQRLIVGVDSLDWVNQINH